MNEWIIIFMFILKFEIFRFGSIKTEFYIYDEFYIYQVATSKKHIKYK